MLKGIHPLLHADLLHALAAMGHGDELVIVDANFPAASVSKRLVQVPTLSSALALDAILTLFPIDTVAKPAVVTMQVIDDIAAVPEPVREFAEVLARHAPAASTASLERHAFYARARSAFVIVRTGELRRYGNVLLVKGVVNRYPPG
ncbi:MAG: RbsD/FucU domain-containing protein [Casimicrobiaceae bacterium]